MLSFIDKLHSSVFHASGNSNCSTCLVSLDGSSSINEDSAPLSVVVPMGRPPEALNPASMVVPLGRPPEALNPASMLVPLGRPPEALNPASMVVPLGRPPEALKPASMVEPIGRPAMGHPPELVNPASMVVSMGRPPEALNPASMVVPMGRPDEALKPVFRVVPIGRPEVTLKPSESVVPTGRPADTLNPAARVVPAGRPFLFKINPQEHIFCLCVTNFSHSGQTFFPFGPGLTSISPDSKSKETNITNNVKSNNSYITCELTLSSDCTTFFELKIKGTYYYPVLLYIYHVS